jgi:nicotinic acid mononucleotide adenylyltransferase
MIYFYGGAFNPMTVTHQEIIADLIANMTDKDRLIIAITTHDYKTYQFSYEVRKEIITKNLVRIPVENKKIRIIEQNERTWKFLQSMTMEQITIVLGEDEYKDLEKGYWHNSQDLLNTYKFKIIPRTNNISATAARDIINTNINDPDILKYITPTTLEYIKSL